MAQAWQGGLTMGTSASTFVTQGGTIGLRFQGAEGWCLRFAVTGSGAVLGHPGWSFRCEELAAISPAFWRLENRGATTIEAPAGRLLLRFQGRVRALGRIVEGQCVAEGLDGCFAGWCGEGSYRGSAGLSFHVTYTVHWRQGPGLGASA